MCRGILHTISPCSAAVQCAPVHSLWRLYRPLHTGVLCSLHCTLPYTALHTALHCTAHYYNLSSLYNTAQHTTAHYTALHTIACYCTLHCILSCTAHWTAHHTTAQRYTRHNSTRHCKSRISENHKPQVAKSVLSIPADPLEIHPKLSLPLGPCHRPQICRSSLRLTPSPKPSSS